MAPIKFDNCHASVFFIILKLRQNSKVIRATFRQKSNIAFEWIARESKKYMREKGAGAISIW